MDAGAIQAAAAASAASYRSFADATRSVLDLLHRQLPDATVFLAHLDRAHDTHRIVDTRNGGEFGLRSNLALPLSESFCLPMAEGAAPGRCNDVASHPVYGRLRAQARFGAASYIGAPLELSDRSRVGSLAALSRQPGAFREDHEKLFALLARVLGNELERESSARDLQRLGDSLRDQARTMAAVGRAAGALATDGDPRPAICTAACEATGAPIAFLLEPTGRELVSTATVGVEMAPVTIQARDSDRAAARAFASLRSYFVADATSHPAVAPPLAEQTGARAALFEPVVREGRVAGVLMLIWREQVPAPSPSIAAALRLVASHAAAAIEQAGLRARLGELALTDPLTGLASRRRFEEEVPRELARARRSEGPVCLAVLDLDRLGGFNMACGEREGDRLIKETASVWAAALREVDLLARFGGGEFAVLLPACAPDEAGRVMDRLRAIVPRQQTASAGVAAWDGDEPAELLLARAQGALTAAKNAGGDSTVAAD